MPSRPWRKCETCEVSDFADEFCISGFCYLSENLYFDDNDKLVASEVNRGFWCSEWKSAEPETCVMCEWFFPFGGKEKGVCHHSMAQPRNYISYLGACEHFRRKDED